MTYHRHVPTWGDPEPLPTCPTCDGAGEIAVTSGPDRFGNFEADYIDCPTCCPSQEKAA